MSTAADYERVENLRQEGKTATLVAELSVLASSIGAGLILSNYLKHTAVSTSAIALTAAGAAGTGLGCLWAKKISNELCRPVNERAADEMEARQRWSERVKSSDCGCAQKR